MDNKAVIAVILLAAGCIIALAVQSRQRLDEIHRLHAAATVLQDMREDCLSELESAHAELETCRRDSEIMGMRLGVATVDLRACGEFYAQREYAADADY